MEKQEISVTEKVQQVKSLVAQTLRERQATSAERTLELARSLMKDVENRVLANPFVTDETISNLVRFLRAPFWSQAEGHIAQLKKAS